MTGKIAEFIAAVKSANLLEDIIGADTHLRRVGGVLKGRSPFHKDSDPSLVIWPHNQTWCDFSGGTRLGSSVIDYVMFRHNLEFMPAVAFLADRAGIPIPHLESDSYAAAYKKASEVRDLRRILSIAADHYHNALTPEIREKWYKTHYGFTDETIDSLQLGWADGALLPCLLSKGISRENAIKSGLFVVSSSGTIHEFFMRRLIFPYWSSGQIVYFIARRTEATGDQDWEKAKYKKLLTHSEKHNYISTVIENSHFYNEDAACNAEEILICEGVTDCISAYQAGIPCISPVTTRFRKQDIPKLLHLAAHAKRVVICNDSEKNRSGAEGACETAAALAAHGRSVDIATIPLPDGATKIDVNELVASPGGPEKLRDIVASAKPYFIYLIDEIPTSTQPSNLDSLLRPILDAAAHATPIERDACLEAIHSRFGVRLSTLRELLRPAPAPDAPISPPPTPHDDGLPDIRIGTDTDRIVTEAIAALRPPRWGVYQRAAQLVQITRVAETETDSLDLVGTPIIRNIAFATLSEKLAGAAHWTRWNQKTETEIKSKPPGDVVSAVLARGEFQGVRPISSISESPILRPDGSIVETPGYDGKTGVEYIPTIQFPAIPAVVTQREAAQRLMHLAGITLDFPYRAEHDRYAVIAALMTVIARPAVKGSVPAFLFDSNCRGSGKSLQADIISIVTTGRPAAKMSWPAREEEVEKSLSGFALRSSSIIVYDNITIPFGTGCLDRVLTCGSQADFRILGESRVSSLPWHAVIIGTGNNLEIVGDTARRVLVSRIETQLERPEERTDFVHPNLLAFVLEHRGEFVADVLAILRSWYAAGCPQGPCKTWGSFESWARIVPPALWYAGGADPMLCRLAPNAESGCNALSVIIQSWDKLPFEEPTLKQVLSELYPPDRLRGQQLPPDEWDDLRDALESLAPPRTGQAPDPIRLGKAMHALAGRVMSGMCLVQRAGKGGVMRWHVSKARTHTSAQVCDVNNGV